MIRFYPSVEGLVLVTSHRKVRGFIRYAEAYREVIKNYSQFEASYTTVPVSGWYPIQTSIYAWAPDFMSKKTAAKFLCSLNLKLKDSRNQYFIARTLNLYKSENPPFERVPKHIIDSLEKLAL